MAVDLVQVRNGQASLGDDLAMATAIWSSIKLWKCLSIGTSRQAWTALHSWGWISLQRKFRCGTSLPRPIPSSKGVTALTRGFNSWIKDLRNSRRREPGSGIPDLRTLLRHQASAHTRRKGTSSCVEGALGFEYDGTIKHSDGSRNFGLIRGFISLGK